MRTTISELTPRERETMDYEREVLRERLQHDRAIKELDQQVAMAEAKITSWFKLPLLIVKLPVMLILAIGYCILAVKGKEPTEPFWQYLK